MVSASSVSAPGRPPVAQYEQARAEWNRPSLSAEALDFAPDLLAIQERPPARLPRALLMLVVFLSALLLLWALFAKLDIIASAEGRLVPLSYTKVVQPAESGVVQEILVQEGSVVKEGQLLLRLDPRLSQSDLSALRRERSIKQLTLRRVEAELSDGAFAATRADPPELFAQVYAQYRARRQSYQDALAHENETLNKANADLLAAQQVLQKLESTLPSYRRSAEAFEQLVQQGFVGELAGAEKTREFIEKERDLQAQRSNVTGLNAVIAQSRQKLLGIRSAYLSQLEGERIETLGLLNKSINELDKSSIKADMLEIRAPNSGVVKDLATTTKGAVVAAGTLLMNIVPQNEPLQAEVLLRNEDVGFVAVGQDVKLKVAAFPFQKYGMLEGKVALVSADSADPKQAPAGQAPALTYKALVKLDSTKLNAPVAHALTLGAGMLVTAEIHQGERTVIEYLLSPVQKLGQEAGRER